MTTAEMVQRLRAHYEILAIAHHSRVSCTTLYRILAGEPVKKSTVAKIRKMYNKLVEA